MTEVRKGGEEEAEDVDLEVVEETMEEKIDRELLNLPCFYVLLEH